MAEPLTQATLCELVEDWPDPGTVVLRARGELDYSVAGRLRRRLDECIERAARGVVVDLEGTSFFDSSTLHALVRAREAAERRGRALAVVCAKPRQRRVFSISLLEDVLRVSDSEREALERVRSA